MRTRAWGDAIGGNPKDSTLVVVGTLKLAQRIVICDSSRIDTLSALPP
jgi:hypothetical protein